MLCARCAAGKGCGAALLGRKGGRRQLLVAVNRETSIQEGDRVRLMLAPRHLLRAASLAYGLPLIAALAAAAVAFNVNASDAVTGAAAMLGFAAGFLVSHRRFRAADCLRNLAPAVESLD